jgi:hypothetical protein
MIRLHCLVLLSAVLFFFLAQRNAKGSRATDSIRCFSMHLFDLGEGELVECESAFPAKRCHRGVVEARRAGKEKTAVSSGRSGANVDSVNAYDTLSQREKLHNTGKSGTAQSHNANVGSNISFQHGELDP